MGACKSKQNKVYRKPSDAMLKEDRDRNKLFEENLRFIQNVPLFARLHPSDVPMLVDNMVTKLHHAGTTIIREGDRGDEFFLVRESQALVYKGDVEITKLRAGDYFGEVCLMEEDALRT